MDPAMAILRQRAPNEVLDYGFVMNCLKEYKNPRVKLHDLLKIKALVRIKKGIYIFGEHFKRQPYLSETLANLIYGPSYVSLEWACQYYRLIPEKVTTVTSVTTKQSKHFQTPVGLFTYDHLPLAVYSIGVNLLTLAERQHALFAMKEKALVDLLVLRRGAFSSYKHFKEIVFEDLRIEEEDVKTLDYQLIKAIYTARPHSAVKYLLELMDRL